MKITFPKIVLVIIGFFMFAWIAPIPQLQLYIRAFPFENYMFLIWFVVIGGWSFIEGSASMPDAKKGASKAGAYFMIGFGISSFIFGIIAFIWNLDVITGSPEVATLASLVLGIGFIFFLTHLFPEIIHRKSMIRALNG